MDEKSGTGDNAVVTPMLEPLLRRPIQVIQKGRLFASKDRAPPRELIVDSPRLLVILSGRLHYVVEERSFTVSAGQAVFVPALVRRHWRCLTRACELAFFSFESDPPLPMDARAWRADAIDARREADAIERVIAASQSGSPLVAEGELKAILARVLSAARPVIAETPHTIGPSHGIHDAMHWMERHFADPHALRRLHERANLSAWHFRRMFRRLTGKSPTEHLMDLRMRSARFRLSQGQRLVKDVAREVGYADALYFSRCYRKFWGHSPRVTQKGVNP